MKPKRGALPPFPSFFFSPFLSFSPFYYDFREEFPPVGNSATKLGAAVDDLERRGSSLPPLFFFFLRPASG